MEEQRWKIEITDPEGSVHTSDRVRPTSFSGMDHSIEDMFEALILLMSLSGYHIDTVKSVITETVMEWVEEE